MHLAVGTVVHILNYNKEDVFHSHIFMVNSYELYALVGYSDQSANRFENRPTKA